MNVRSSQRIAYVALAVIGGLSLSAQAEEVLLDFGTTTSYRGLAVSPNPDANGNYWNSVVPGNYYGPGTTPLTTSTGAATTDAEGFTTSVATDSYNGPAGDTSNGGGYPNNPNALPNLEADAAKFTLTGAVAASDLNNNYAAFDYAAGSGNFDAVGPVLYATQFTLSGLNTGETYSLTFYGAHTYDTQYTTYAVFSNPLYTSQLGSATLATETTDPNSTPNSMPPVVYPDVNLSNLVTISGLTPTPDAPGSSTGSLYVEFYGDTNGTEPYDTNSGAGYLNSMEILGSAVPEPASLGLLAIGGLLVARRRRRAC